MYRKTVLSNGMRVISEEIAHVRSVSIGIWIECGSRYEDSRTNGAAHFIEHMLFKGTERRSAFDIAAAIDSVGGVMNAFTSKELTSFYIKIPDYHLALAIDLLADILKNSQFEENEIGKEKSVVLQEISMLEDSPDDYIHDFFEANFWQGDHLDLPVLGSGNRSKDFPGRCCSVFSEAATGAGMSYSPPPATCSTSDLWKWCRRLSRVWKRAARRSPFRPLS